MTYTDRQIQILDYVERIDKLGWSNAPEESEEFKGLRKIKEEVNPTDEEIWWAMSELWQNSTLPIGEV